MPTNKHFTIIEEKGMLSLMLLDAIFIDIRNNGKYSAGGINYSYSSLNCEKEKFSLCYAYDTLNEELLEKFIESHMAKHSCNRAESITYIKRQLAHTEIFVTPKAEKILNEVMIGF